MITKNIGLLLLVTLTLPIAFGCKNTNKDPGLLPANVDPCANAFSASLAPYVFKVQQGSTFVEQKLGVILALFGAQPPAPYAGPPVNAIGAFQSASSPANDPDFEADFRDNALVSKLSGNYSPSSPLCYSATYKTVMEDEQETNYAENLIWIKFKNGWESTKDKQVQLIFLWDGTDAKLKFVDVPIQNGTQSDKTSMEMHFRLNRATP